MTLIFISLGLGGRLWWSAGLLFLFTNRQGLKAANIFWFTVHVLDKWEYSSHWHSILLLQVDLPCRLWDYLI